MMAVSNEGEWLGHAVNPVHNAAGTLNTARAAVKKWANKSWRYHSRVDARITHYGFALSWAYRTPV
jgi:hypothetical protein